LGHPVQDPTLTTTRETIIIITIVNKINWSKFSIQRSIKIAHWSADSVKKQQRRLESSDVTHCLFNMRAYDGQQ